MRTPPTSRPREGNNTIVHKSWKSIDNKFRYIYGECDLSNLQTRRCKIYDDVDPDSPPRWLGKKAREKTTQAFEAFCGERSSCDPNLRSTPRNGAGLVGQVRERGGERESVAAAVTAMASRNGHVWTVLVLLLLAFTDPCLGRGNRDIMHDDAETPKQPGCENSFVLVSSKFLHWILQDLSHFAWLGFERRID